MLYGISLLIPMDIPSLPSIKSLDPELKDDDIKQEKGKEKETDKETDKEKDTKIDNAITNQSVPSGCYDNITVRDGKVYLFQNNQPLQEGSNPKIFSDLPTYRVWAESMMFEGIRCPVLYLDPNAKPYVHPEEKYPDEVPMVSSNIVNGKRRKYEATVQYIDYGSGFTNKPYLVDTPDTLNEYEYDLYKTDKPSTINEGFSNRERKNQRLYDSVTEPMRHIADDDLLVRSQHDGLGLGMDQKLPVMGRNFRDVPEKVVRNLLEKQDPYFKGAVLRRVGTSKYEVSEINPERDESQDDRQEVMNRDFVVGNTVPIDLLAYGGTLVPAGSVHGLF